MRSAVGMRRFAARCVAMACLAIAPQVTAADEPIGAAAIQQAVEKARDFLVRQQDREGWWEAMNSTDRRAGATGLVLLALANAGLEADNPTITRGLTWLRTQVPDDTYAVSLQTLALAMLAPEADAAILARNVRWLEAAQVQTGPGAGSWSYKEAPGATIGDNSNTQFALLALHEAARAGIPVRHETWVRSQQYWVSCANADGSWGYSGRTLGTGSMTCAGIASIWITTENIGIPDAQPRAGSVSCCGGGRSPDVLENGLDWLGRRFSVTQNPGTGGDTWLYYYLYGLERVGRFTARRYIGEHDWYREGARMFVDAQDRLSGQFAARRIEDATVATSFALLFLAKGRRPVLVAKSRHGPESDWNRHGHDIAHLVEYVEGRWKKDYPAGLSWHVLDTPAAGHADLMQSPVLWLSGKDLFDLGPNAGPRLRAYLDEGGFLFAEACCPKSQEFDRRFRQLVGEIFPEPEYRLNLLPPEHPAWNAEEIVPPDLQRALLGIDYGCRTSLIYAPPADGNGKGGMPSLSCLWELGGPGRKRLPPAIGREVDAALAIGANVLAYATDRELKRKDELFNIAMPAAGSSRELVRGQLAIGKLRHAGQCDAAPAALANILRAAAREVGVEVDDAPSLIDPSDDALFDYHMVFMHGRQGFAFDATRRERLGTFLDRGGMLVADSICASPAFTAAFRKEIAHILPGKPLVEIPPDDPIFSATEYGGYDIRTVTLREPSDADGPRGLRKRQTSPKLEGVQLGDRWAVIFSPYDLSCALEKQSSMECPGYAQDDAEKIALNILLYSLNQ